MIIINDNTVVKPHSWQPLAYVMWLTTIPGRTDKMSHTTWLM